MKRPLRAIWRKIKELWNVYGGILFSTLIAWLNNWNKLEMDKWSSYLILTLTCISVLTFFKIIYFKKKKPSPIDNATQPKATRMVKTALDPLSLGQDVGGAIIYTVKGGKKTMQKIKNFFKELWGNKFTITNTIVVLFMATLSQIATYTDYLYRFQWCADNKLLIQILSPIVAGIIVFIDLFTTYTKYGFESLKELADRKAQKKIDNMSKAEKKVLKDNLKDLQKTLKIVSDKRYELAKVIEKTDLLLGAGYNLNSNEKNEYDANKDQLTNIDNTIKNLETKIEEITSKLN